MALTLSQISGMPQMGSAFMGWGSPVVLKKIVQTIVDGLVISTETDISYKAVIQPLATEQIQLKPEGQRSWQWLQIHCVSGENNLKTNDLVSYNGTSYKIMAVRDYSLNNFIEYHAIADYEAVE